MLNMMILIKTLFLVYIFPQCLTQVVELDDSFEEVKGDDPWLVEFYAPWCGHCRRLAPVYHQVNLALQNTPIKVAKVDATRYSQIAADYDVRGYPTIKFIQGNTVYTHRGDRSRDGIIEFAKRAQGPQVRPLSNVGKFHDARSEHSHQVFYLYVGALDPFGDLMSKYTSLAEKYAVMSYFYAIEREILPKNYITSYDASILVFKDDTYYEYKQPEHGPTKLSLDNWVNGELYEAFPKMSSGSLNEMGELHKKLAMFIVDEKDRMNEAKHERLKELGRIMATQYRDKYHKHFQFLWMGENESANQITMSWIDPPQIMVLDPSTQYYFWPPFAMEHATLDSIGEFLETVVNGTAAVYGGTGFLKRIQRLGWDIYTTVYALWHEAGWLALLIFGVPAIVITIVCYALCCMDPIDENLEEEEVDSDYEQGDLPNTETPQNHAQVHTTRRRKKVSDSDTEKEALLPSSEGIEVEAIPPDGPIPIETEVPEVTDAHIKAE